MKRLLFALIMILISALSVFSESIIVISEVSESDLDLDYAHVVKVKADKNAGAWRFDVTVRHNDQGWNHYADLWIVIDPETGEVYGRRVLGHPHDNEQPFTRSQSGLRIPEEVTTVLVKAACTVHGFGGTELLVELK